MLSKIGLTTQGEGAGVGSHRLNLPHPHNPHNGQPSIMPSRQIQSHLQSQLPTTAWPPYYASDIVAFPSSGVLIVFLS